MTEYPYRLLIVDDERAVRVNIQYAIARSNVSFAAILEATNGQEALLLIEHGNVDMVLTDIRMPLMDGLTLLNCARELYPEMPFIILTVHSEFEYARSALKAGVADYVLKPCADDEVIAALRRAADELRAQHRERSQREMSGYLSRQQFKLRLREFLGTAVIAPDGQEIPLPDIPAFQKGLVCAPYALCAVRVSSPGGSFRESEKPLMGFAAHNMIEELTEGQALLAENELERYQLLLLLYGDAARDARGAMESLLERMDAAGTGVALHVGISQRFEALNELRAAYEQTQLALAQRFADSGRHIHTAPPERALRVAPERGIVRMFALTLGAGRDAESIEATLKLCVDTLLSGPITPAQLKLACAEIMRAILAERPEARIDEALLTGEIMDQLSGRDEWIALVLTQARAAGLMDGGGQRQWIDAVRRYIDAHYAEPLSLQIIADQFHISAKHLSRSFKAAVGMDFSDYLTQVRLDSAKQLLCARALSISDVAQAVGYSDVQYFHRVFKRAEGMTPSTYRDQE